LAEDISSINSYVNASILDRRGFFETSFFDGSVQFFSKHEIFERGSIGKITKTTKKRTLILPMLPLSKISCLEKN
jgi:hypothetical protein